MARAAHGRMGVWALGFGSLFMDMSSELIHSLLPIFMVAGLGTSMLTEGVLEGLAEATAAITKIFSGALSDFFSRRRFLLELGYALAAFTKPVFPLATSLGWVFAARFVDRIGKGIRGAPRDALVAVVLMIWWANDIQAVMWVAVLPAHVTAALLMIYVREPARVPAALGTPLTQRRAR